jgi:tol-pal system protein YbgF
VSLATLGAAGCAHGESAQDKQFAEMRETISRMQLERDRVDHRLEALELAVAEEKSPSDGSKDVNKAPPGPPPRTVQLGADVTENEDPNDVTQRPEIKVSGGAGGVAPSRARGGGDASRASVLDPDAKKTYEQGLSQVQGKQYDKGLDTLAAFLVKWPDHPYAENAMYWRGEAYYAKGDYAKAQESFEGVLSRFGSGKKAPDALLKLGLCQDRLGSSARAQEYFDRLKRDYPQSDAAKRIPAPGREDRSKGPKESR